MGNYIMGKNTVLEVLRKKRGAVLKIFILKRREEKNCEIETLSREFGVPISYISRNELTSLVSSESHQGYIAKIRNREFLNLDHFFKIEREILSVLMLDEILDPHNMGALLRSALFFGVDAVVFSKNRGSDITAVVSKSSSGASELIPMIRVSNLADSIRRFKEEGFEIVAADCSGRFIPLSHFSFSKKVLIIVGSEGRGVRRLNLKLSDHIVGIEGNMESLNVSQAAAVFLNKMKESHYG